MITAHDPTALSHAWLREGLSSLGHGLLFPFGFLPSSHHPQRSRGLRTVVFVHGLAANRASLFPLQLWLRTLGYDRQLSYNHASGPSLEALALQLKRITDAQVRGGRIDVVAHSMGGLIARTWIQKLDGARRVDRLITLGTPHHGTWAAKFVPTAMLDQLSPDGPFLADLNARPMPEHLRCTSVGVGNDHLVLPRDSARMPWGEHHHFDEQGHTSMLWSPAVFGVVAHALGAAKALGVDAPVVEALG